MKVLVYCPHKTLTVEFDEEKRVRLLKLSISILIGVPTDAFRLFSKIQNFTILLSESWSLAFYGVSEVKVNFITKFHETAEEFYKRSFLKQAISSCQSSSSADFSQLVQQYTDEIGVDLDVGNISFSTEWTLMHYAAYFGNTEILSFLLSHPSKVNAVTIDQWTPLQLAVYCGHLQCTELLLRCPNIQVDKRTKFRGTALHLACEQNNSAIIELLLQFKPSISIEDQNRKNPVEICTDVAALEMLAIYAGTNELHKYETLKQQMPSDFCGEVYLFNQMFIKEKSDKVLFMYMNAREGFLAIYSDKEIYVKEKAPDKIIRLAMIKDVGPVEGPKYNSSLYYFAIVSAKRSLNLYTKYRQLTNEWIERLREAVSYALIYQSNESPEKEDPRETVMTAPKYSIAEDTIRLASFEITEEIGIGDFGEVYKVRLKKTHELFAMKMLSKNKLQTKGQLRNVSSECKILKQLEHPFIVKLYYDFQTHKFLFLILEYCSGGNLSSLIQSKNRLSESVAQFYMAQIVLAIEYLHSLDILYRDLKPANVLLAEDGYIRLGDFGWAKENVNEVNPALSIAGSMSYMSPEIMMHNGASPASDVYGLGAILYEMLIGTAPHFIERRYSVRPNSDKVRFKFPDWVSESAKNLINLMMNINPNQRPKLPQIKTHRFFSKIDWDALMAKRLKVPDERSVSITSPATRISIN